MEDYKLMREFVLLEKTADNKDAYFSKPNYNTEQVLYEGTPLILISFLLKYISPIENKVIYDLGCGYGRFVFFGALNYKKTFFKGIEIIEERVTTAQRFSDKMNLKNALFIHENVLNLNLLDGDVFYLFNPFSDDTLLQVIEKLKLISKEKNIIILAVGPVTNTLSEQNWLKILFDKRFKFRGLDLYTTSIYSSII